MKIKVKRSMTKNWLSVFDNINVLFARKLEGEIIDCHTKHIYDRTYIIP